MPDGLEREPKGCQAGSVAQDRGGRLGGSGKRRQALWLGKGEVQRSQQVFGADLPGGLGKGRPRGAHRTWRGLVVQRSRVPQKT